jgi:hypothetical protein
MRLNLRNLREADEIDRLGAELAVELPELPLVYLAVVVG